MNAQELIAMLQLMPQHMEVGVLWDGGIRTFPTAGWVTQDGHIGLGEVGDTCYEGSDRPIGAPCSGRYEIGDA